MIQRVGVHGIVKPDTVVKLTTEGGGELVSCPSNYFSSLLQFDL